MTSSEVFPDGSWIRTISWVMVSDSLFEKLMTMLPPDSVAGMLWNRNFWTKTS